MSEDEYTMLIRDENDPVIFTVFPNHRREMEKFTQMSQDDEAGLKVCFGVNFKNKHVVWMCSSDEVELPNGQCIMDRCTIK